VPSACFQIDPTGWNSATLSRVRASSLFAHAPVMRGPANHRSTVVIDRPPQSRCGDLRQKVLVKTGIARHLGVERSSEQVVLFNRNNTTVR
jgi:hypothetical protein